MTKWTPAQIHEMHKLYTQDLWPLDIVGHQFGISRERVRQLFEQEHLPTRERGAKSSTSALKNLAEAEKRHDEIIKTYKEVGNVEDVAAAFQLPPIYISRIVDTIKLRELYRRRGRAEPKSEDDMEEALRRAADAQGEPLTIPAYRKVAKALMLPADRTLVKHYGTFQAACEKAGVKCNPARGPRKKSITKGQCIEAVRECHRQLGKRPSYAEYTAWAKNEGKPSGPTVRAKCGSWGAAYRAAFAR